VVIFDDVHIPCERCFVLGDPELCNGFYAKTSAVAHMTHQVVTRTTAKTEYILGLVSLLTEAIGIEQFQHVQEEATPVLDLDGIPRPSPDMLLDESAVPVGADGLG
jgi:4-hydroxyphenylacetate 3-monooxygenase